MMITPRTRFLSHPSLADVRASPPPPCSTVPAYALLALVHLGLTVWTRQWWLIVLAIGAGLETAGNALRIHGHYSSVDVNPYIAMQVLVVVTPAFFAAIHFAILGKVLILFGKKYSVVSPKWIIPFFVTLDVASLAVQGAGSGIAATNEIDNRDPRGGANIVVGGLAVQLLGYVIFDILALLFARKAFSSSYTAANQAPTHFWTRRTKIAVIMAFISALLVLLRSCFRTAEMINGWIGPIAQKEWLYYAFDATPVTLAVLLLAIWHPGFYLPRAIVPPEHERDGLDVEKHEAKSHDGYDGHHEGADLSHSPMNGRSDAESSATHAASGTPAYKIGGSPATSIKAQQ